MNEGRKEKREGGVERGREGRKEKEVIRCEVVPFNILNF